MGGPTYIADPRVEEAIRMGELLARNRQVQIEAADRLFGQRQQTAEFDERRRQFNETQKRYADAQKMAAAEADRGYGLEERKLGQADAREGRLAAEAAQQRAAEEARAQRSFAMQERGYDLQAQELGDRRTDRSEDNAREKAAQEAAQRRYEAELVAKKRQEEAARDERRTSGKEAFDRQAELQRRGFVMEGERLDARDAIEEKKIRARADEADKKREAERVRLEGTEQQRRDVAKAARAARFRDALDAATANRTEDLSEKDQADAVRRAYREAIQPDLDPQQRTYEAASLGEQGEAESNAELAQIADEYFPAETYFNETPWAQDPLARLGENVANRLLPDFLREYLLGGRPDTYQTSGGQAEADRLFKRLPGARR